MKPFISMICLAMLIALVGCSDPKPVNVLENADQAKIDEYNRLNGQAQEAMVEDAALAADQVDQPEQ